MLQRVHILTINLYLITDIYYLNEYNPSIKDYQDVNKTVTYQITFN
jgi:hypothetical protein